MIEVIFRLLGALVGLLAIAVAISMFVTGFRDDQVLSQLSMFLLGLVFLSYGVFGKRRDAGVALGDYTEKKYNNHLWPFYDRLFA